MILLLVLLSLTITASLGKEYALPSLTKEGNDDDCIRLLQLASALHHVQVENSTLILWGEWITYVIASLDFPLLEHHHDVRIEDVPREDVEFIFPSSNTDDGKEREDVIQHLLPRSDDRREAEEILRADYMIRPLIGVHLHPCDAEKTYCHASSISYRGGCRVPQLDAIFLDTIHREWPELVPPYSFYVTATSGLSSPFFYPLFDEITRFQTIQGTGKRFVDMWVNTLADYYVANPTSVCDSIVAQWRAGRRQRQHHSIYPRDCFLPF
jgi:hypothetical protein